jgi:hypothetical protein
LSRKSQDRGGDSIRPQIWVAMAFELTCDLHDQRSRAGDFHRHVDRLPSRRLDLLT